MRCLILSAGLGTRLGSLTKNTPKPMVKIAGKPCLEHIVDHLNSYGITEIIVNTHYLPEKIYKHFGTRLLYSYEPELLGEEKTILSLKDWLGDRFIVCNGDTLTDVNLYKMMRFYPSCRYMDGDVYAGTEIIHFNTTPKKYYQEDAFWIDIGDPSRLKKARKYFKNQL